MVWNSFWVLHGPPISETHELLRGCIERKSSRSRSPSRRTIPCESGYTLAFPRKTKAVTCNSAISEPTARREDLSLCANTLTSANRALKDSRPELNILMDDARKRRFDAIVVWRFDRFARSTKHLLLALGIQFISYQENIDTSSALGRRFSRSCQWSPS
jgi:Resolvase, N terminal domain